MNYKDVVSERIDIIMIIMIMIIMIIIIMIMIIIIIIMITIIIIVVTIVIINIFHGVFSRDEAVNRLSNFVLEDKGVL